MPVVHFSNKSFDRCSNGVCHSKSYADSSIEVSVEPSQNTNLDMAVDGLTNSEVALKTHREDLCSDTFAISDRLSVMKIGKANDSEDEPASPIESLATPVDQTLFYCHDPRIQCCVLCGDGHAAQILVISTCGHHY